MKKVIALNRALSRLNLHVEAYHILKLARESDLKYFEAAELILGMIKGGTAKKEDIGYAIRYTVMGILLSRAFPDEDVFKKFDGKWIDFEFNFVKPSDKDVMEAECLKEGPIESDAYKKQKKELEKRIDFRWITFNGDASKVIYGDTITLKIQLFLDPKSFEENKSNLIEYVEKNDSRKSTFIHELTHAINTARSRYTPGSKAKGGANQYDSSRPEYTNSTEEIQARLIPIYIKLREELIEACPRLKYIKYNPNYSIDICPDEIKNVPFFEMLNTNNFIKFLNYVKDKFRDKLYLNSNPSKETIDRYNLRIYNMFNDLRNTLKLTGDQRQTGLSAFYRNLAEIQRKRKIEENLEPLMYKSRFDLGAKILSEYPDQKYLDDNDMPDGNWSSYPTFSLKHAIVSCLGDSSYSDRQIVDLIINLIKDRGIITPDGITNEFISKGLLPQLKQSGFQKISGLVYDYLKWRYDGYPTGKLQIKVIDNSLSVEELGYDYNEYLESIS